MCQVLYKNMTIRQPFWFFFSPIPQFPYVPPRFFSCTLSYTSILSTSFLKSNTSERFLPLQMMDKLYFFLLFTGFYGADLIAGDSFTDPAADPGSAVFPDCHEKSGAAVKGGEHLFVRDFSLFSLSGERFQGSAALTDRSVHTAYPG